MARAVVPNGFLRRGQVAKIFGVGVSLVRYWQKTGKLPYVIDPRTGWWLSPADIVHARAEEDGRLAVPGSKAKRAYEMFAAGKRPRDVVQAIEGMTPERARALWELYRLDDEPEVTEPRETSTSSRAESARLEEQDRREQDAYDASIDEWTREQAEARRRAEEEHERDARAQAERLARRKPAGAAKEEPPTYASGTMRSVKGRAIADTPAAATALDTSELLTLILTKLASTG